MRGGKQCTTCPSLCWLAPCCWHQPPSRFQLLVPQFARLGFATGLREAPESFCVKCPQERIPLPEPLCPRQERHTSSVTLSQAAPGAPAPSQDAHCCNMCRQLAEGSWGLGNLPSHSRTWAPLQSCSTVARCIHHPVHPPLPLPPQRGHPRSPQSLPVDQPNSSHPPTAANLHTRSVQGLRDLPMPHTTFPCRRDGSSWEEVGLGQVTALPTSSCRAGSWSGTQGSGHVTRWERLAPNIPGCGTWRKPEPCSVNAQRCYI